MARQMSRENLERRIEKLRKEIATIEHELKSIERLSSPNS